MLHYWRHETTQYALTVSDIVLYAVFIYGELLYCRISPVRDGDDIDKCYHGEMTQQLALTVSDIVWYAVFIW